VQVRQEVSRKTGGRQNGDVGSTTPDLGGQFVSIHAPGHQDVSEQQADFRIALKDCYRFRARSSRACGVTECFDKLHMEFPKLVIVLENQNFGVSWWKRLDLLHKLDSAGMQRLCPRQI
jgi:hypothetical protein